MKQHRSWSAIRAQEAQQLHVVITQEAEFEPPPLFKLLRPFYLRPCRHPEEVQP